MAIQVEVPRVSPRRAADVETCPYCGQPLLDHDTVRRVEESKREAETRLEEAANVRAAELAKALTAQQTRKVELLKETLAAAKAVHREELRSLRISVRASPRPSQARGARRNGDLPEL